MPNHKQRAPSDGTQLILAHFDFIWRLLRRLGLAPVDADDVAQQVFMTATRKLTQIVPGRERTYLYGIALRALANFKRKARHHREQLGTELSGLLDSAPLPDEAAELRAARDLADELLAKLPPELRRVLVLASIEQLELSEIAELEEIPQGTAASRLRRARERFKAELSEVRQRMPFDPEVERT